MNRSRHGLEFLHELRHRRRLIEIRKIHMASECFALLAIDKNPYAEDAGDIVRKRLNH